MTGGAFVAQKRLSTPHQSHDPCATKNNSSQDVLRPDRHKEPTAAAKTQQTLFHEAFKLSLFEGRDAPLAPIRDRGIGRGTILGSVFSWVESNA